MPEKKKECPQSVKEAGAALVDLRREARRFVEKVNRTESKIAAAASEMKEDHGMRWMQTGVAYKELGAMHALPGSVAVAHDSLRLMLGECGVEEPTDDDIIIILGGGGGGGR